MIASAGFAREGRGRPEDMETRRPHDRGDMMSNRGGMENMPMHDRQMRMLVRLAGAEEITIKYQAEMKKIFLDAKRETVDLVAKRGELMIQLRKYAEAHNAGNDVSARDVAKTLRELSDIENKIEENRKKAMDQIARLNQRRERELNNAVNNWIRQIERDPEEFNRLMNTIKEEPANRRSRMRKPGDSEKTKPNKPEK